MDTSTFRTYLPYISALALGVIGLFNIRDVGPAFAAPVATPAKRFDGICTCDCYPGLPQGAVQCPENCYLDFVCTVSCESTFYGNAGSAYTTALADCAGLDSVYTGAMQTCATTRDAAIVACGTNQTCIDAANAAYDGCSAAAISAHDAGWAIVSGAYNIALATYTAQYWACMYECCYCEIAPKPQNLGYSPVPVKSLDALREPRW